MDSDYQWLSDMLGKPWRAYATGECVDGVAAWDCWGVFFYAAERVLDTSLDRHLDVPTKNPRAFARVAAQEVGSGDWRKLSIPKHGCAVLMAEGARFQHVGMWLDINGGRLLHSREGAGVVLDGAVHLSNYNLVEYWEYVGKNNDL